MLAARTDVPRTAGRLQRRQPTRSWVVVLSPRPLQDCSAPSIGMRDTYRPVCAIPQARIFIGTQIASVRIASVSISRRAWHDVITSCPGPTWKYTHCEARGPRYNPHECDRNEDAKVRVCFYLCSRNRKQNVYYLQLLNHSAFPSL